MELNHDKCEVMHFAKSNGDRTYSVDGRALKNVNEQRDLGPDVGKWD